jgi:two-component system, chemotaxis family, sensor kinase CheA
MTLDLAQFHETFFEESFEALDSMEAALLKLSAGAVDAELINTIFRVAHSIKGGSATFGFTDVAGFTHTAETLLDQIRAGKRQVTPELVDLFLRSGDLMRGMLVATKEKQPLNQARVSSLRAEIEAVLASKPVAAGAQPTVAAAPAAAPPAILEAAGPCGWRIHFVPGPKLLRHGNDPLRLLRELNLLGSCAVRADAMKIPPLADLDAEE